MNSRPFSINASIVIYNTPLEELETVVHTLRECNSIRRILLIDNSERRDGRYGEIAGAEWIWNGRNVGYGAAHNIAIRESIETGIDYHLVINSDIIFTAAVIAELSEYMECHPRAAQIIPGVVSPDGSNQHPARLLPTPYDLIARRFLPESMNRKRTARFELHGLSRNREYNIPYLSGCFMLLRCSALKRTGLFDERFFMYPEDIDLTRRLHKDYETVYYPRISIIHNHRRGSYHNIRLLAVHITNMVRYFNKWGWIIDRERNRENKKVLYEIEKDR